MQDKDSKITKMLMDNGADSMIPNVANKESAFHYCGKSGNSEVVKEIIKTSTPGRSSWSSTNSRGNTTVGFRSFNGKCVD